MRKTVKMPLKFVTVNDNVYVFQLVGDFRPPDPSLVQF